MTTTSEQDTANERLARVEATVESLVQEIGQIQSNLREMRAEMRAHFLWILGILPGVIASSMIALIVTLILKG